MSIKTNDSSGSDGETEFYDCEDVFAPLQMSVEDSLEEAEKAIDLFFNNKYCEAFDLMKSFAEKSLYHTMGNAMFLFLEATLTFEKAQISKASSAIDKCLDMCIQYKRKSTFYETFGKSFRKRDYNRLTDWECHAELCFAEALLLKAVLTFIEDENLTSLIRGSVKISKCFNSYKECAQIERERTQWQSTISQKHFKSGVLLGIGTFNLMISMLPGSAIKLLQFIGFSGDKDSGLRKLETGSQLQGLRQVLCSLCLLGFHLIVTYVLSPQEGDLKLCQHILENQMLQYPNSVWFLFFKGRLEFVQGRLEAAHHWYINSWKSQSIWIQFHHLNFWELFWVNCLRLRWRKSGEYAALLLESSKWSKTIYSYQNAAVLLMLDDATTEENQCIRERMSAAPQFKQRIAGKSLPLEKFICKKTERYFKQGEKLCLPAFELMYIWNSFKILRKRRDILETIRDRIDRELYKLTIKDVSEFYDVDNRALCLLLRGTIYRHMEKHDAALEDFKACTSLDKNIKEDTYIIPYAWMEIGLLYADTNRKDLAIFTLENIKKKFHGFLLESRLQFRIHSALMELNRINV